MLSNPALTETQKATLEKQLTNAETTLRQSSEGNAFMSSAASFNDLSEQQQKQVYQSVRCRTYTNI